MSYYSILAQLPGLFMVMNKQSQFICANAYTADLLGFRHLDDMLGMTAYAINCPAVECAAEFICQDQHVLCCEHELSFLDIHTYARGGAKIMITKKKPLYRDSVLIGLICHCSEVDQAAIVNVVKILTRSDQRFYCRSNSIERTYYIGNAMQRGDLSPREMDCLFYIIRGKSGRRIAQILRLSENTVDSYIKGIKHKLKCTTRAQIIEIALKYDLHRYIPDVFLCGNISKLL